jgi:hypothetical protein
MSIVAPFDVVGSNTIIFERIVDFVAGKVPNSLTRK